MPSASRHPRARAAHGARHRRRHLAGSLFPLPPCPSGATSPASCTARPHPSRGPAPRLGGGVATHIAGNPSSEICLFSPFIYSVNRLFMSRTRECVFYPLSYKSVLRCYLVTRTAEVVKKIPSTLLLNESPIDEATLVHSFIHPFFHKVAEATGSSKNSGTPRVSWGRTASRSRSSLRARRRASRRRRHPGAP